MSADWRHRVAGDARVHFRCLLLGFEDVSRCSRVFLRETRGCCLTSAASVTTAEHAAVDKPLASGTPPSRYAAEARR
jgi:hypothetical protein